jgi:hypothetical protein
MDMCALLMLEVPELIVIPVIVEALRVWILAVGDTLSVLKLPVDELLVVASMVLTAITDTLKILEFKLAALTVFMVAVVPTIVVAVRPLAFIVLALAVDV